MKHCSIMCRAALMVRACERLCREQPKKSIFRFNFLINVMKKFHSEPVIGSLCLWKTPFANQPFCTFSKENIFEFLTFPCFAGGTRVLLVAPRIVPGGEHLSGARWGSHVCPPTKNHHHTAQQRELPGVKSWLPKQ